MYQPQASRGGAYARTELEYDHTLTRCHPDQPVKRARVFFSAGVGPEGSAPRLFLRPQAERHSSRCFYRNSRVSGKGTISSGGAESKNAPTLSYCPVTCCLLPVA